MDEDTAYVEAVGSARALASLQYLGLPIPQDRLGGVLRYQTDHDEVGRATSCGPRTSRLMVQVLAREAIRLDVPIFNHTTAVRLLVDEGSPRRAAGVLAMRPKRRTDENPLGLRASSLRLPGHRGRRPRRALSRQRLSPALLRLARARAGGGHRSGQPDREPVRHRHVARRLSVESLRDLRAVHALRLFARRRRPRAQFSRRLLPNHAANSPRTYFARAINGRSTRRACSTSARACSISPCFARRRRGGACSWISTAIRLRFRATRHSRSRRARRRRARLSRRNPARCSQRRSSGFAR